MMIVKLNNVLCHFKSEFVQKMWEKSFKIDFYRSSYIVNTNNVVNDSFLYAVILWKIFSHTKGNQKEKKKSFFSVAWVQSRFSSLKMAKIRSIRCENVFSLPLHLQKYLQSFGFFFFFESTKGIFLYWEAIKFSQYFLNEVLPQVFSVHRVFYYIL